MASNPSPNSSGLPKFYTTLDPFNKLKIKIGLELTRVDVRVLKSAFVGKLSNHTLNAIDPKVEGAGVELLDCLQQSGFFSPSNLNLVKEALKTANCALLVQILDEYAKTVTEATDLPLSLMEELPGPTSYLLQLLITGQKCYIGSSRIDVLKESLCDKLGVKISDVAFAQLTEANQDSTFMTLQFPRTDDKVEQLILAAVNKAEWLVNLGILQLKINDKAPICIDENVVEIKQVPRKETKILDLKPAFLHHHDNALDLILVVEFPFSVTPHILKNMLTHCQSAIHALSQGIDMRLAIVTYGNHFQCQPTEPIAFRRQEFSNNLDFKSRVKNELQCGAEQGPSGLADALAAVRELTKEGNVRKEATKMCVCINFLVEELQTLEHYRCSHGNDAIELCGNLADNGVTLYVFGIDVSLLKVKINFFLEGIAAIGGGRYFQLEIVEHLEEAINCVTKHDMSVEKQGQVTSKIVKEDITSSHGAIRYTSLPKAIEQNLNGNGLTVDILKENGKSLKQVSKLAQKISLADNLDEAIKIVGPILRKQDSNNRSASKGRTQALMPGKEFGQSSGKAVVGKKARLQQKCSLSLKENQPIDLECAVRIMEKQLHRLAYFEIPEPEDEEMMSID